MHRGVRNYPPPSPSWASAKVSCQGANKLEANIFLMTFYVLFDFMKNLQISINKSLINHLETNTSLILGVGWSKYWSLLPPPHPHPRRQQKSLAGVKTIKKKHMFDDPYDFCEKQSGTSLMNHLNTEKTLKN